MYAPDTFDQRWHEIGTSIAATGTYTQTYEELAFGARLAVRSHANPISSSPISKFRGRVCVNEQELSTTATVKRERYV